MAVNEPDVMAAAATVLSPDGTDRARDHVVAEMVVALFKTTGIVPDEAQDLDVVVEQIRMFESAIDALG